MNRAHEVAEQLGIPFRLIDVQEEFKEAVVDTFVAEYAAGRTPCPCVPCNRTIRFGFLLELALRSGAEFIATGHYARIQLNGGHHKLLRGVDPQKDQSYFLHILGQHQLAHALFPLGEMTQPRVREIARERGLPVADQPDSQDLCFLATGDYRDFLAQRLPELFTPGPIRDTQGRSLGEHQGLPAYTIGQRRGPNITSAGSAAKPFYVVDIISEENALIVGTWEELAFTTCLVDETHMISGEAPQELFRAEAQIRSQAAPSTVTVTPLSEQRVRVDFDVPQRDVAPGQYLVLYDGEETLGGGVILPQR
ncbi:MAG: tRNA 2-thiouridine(34) synthase MnmA [Anaerolineae bacterium]|nr:tRNA 2-thiouridine(34) synthase MnmA [Anaerolineae bacterium]